MKISLKYFRCLKNCTFYDTLFLISKLRQRRGELYSTFNVVKQFISKAFKMSNFHTSSMCSCEPQYSLVDWVLRHPYMCSLAWDECLVVFKHNSPDVIIKRVNVRRVWWPFIFANKFTAVGGNPVLSQLCRVSRSIVLLGNETRRRRDLHSSIIVWVTGELNVTFSVYFSLVRYGRRHNYLDFTKKRCSLTKFHQHPFITFWDILQHTDRQTDRQTDTQNPTNAQPPRWR